MINSLFFISDIITEKITINPPIFNIVVIEFSMEFFTATPRLGEEWCSVFRETVLVTVLFFFVINPMNKQEI